MQPRCFGQQLIQLPSWWIASLVLHYQPMIQAQFKIRLAEARPKILSIKVDWKTSDDDPRSAIMHLSCSHRAAATAPSCPSNPSYDIGRAPDWRFLFIGSDKSVISVGRAYATKHQQIIGKLDLMVLPEPWEIDTKEKVFRLLT